jgi:peptidoglycan hydrolase-like protein with peptidoglycan-binding domain
MPGVTQPQGKPAVAQPQNDAQHIVIAGVSVAQVQAKVGVTADGVWGPVTNQAVIKWQSAHGLQADGIVGPKTWWAMNAQNAPAQTPAPAHQSEPTIAQGATGGAVRLLQQRLGGIAVDGQFGPKTAEAVRAWQVNHHLSVDGVVGPQTWASLGV